MKTTPFLTLLSIAASTVITMGQVIPNQYIAVFKDDARDHPAAAHALAAQHGLEVGHVYEHALKGFAFGGSPQAAAALARRPGIAYVEPDQVFYAWEQTLPTGINRADVDATGVIDGTDDMLAVDIAIIDTGLDSDHPDLRIDPAGVRFYAVGRRIVSDANWEDDNGHGTHVGGTAAAVDNTEGVVGVAPGARLTAVKVLDRNGSGSASTVIAGIDWVAARADRFEVANMSLGSSFYQPVNTAVANAVAKGVVFVVAAGNESADAATKSPASEPTAITVSALADSDGLPGGTGPDFYTSEGLYTEDDTFAPFSNYGAVVDICAPGVLILSTVPGGGYDGTYSGTSMASPHVAGAAALYIWKNGLTKSAAGVETVANALKTTGWKPGDDEYLLSGDPDNYAEPLLNVGALMGTVEPPDAPPTVSITSPVKDAVVSGAVTITATAVDDVGVTKVEFFTGNNSIGADIDGDDGWSISWNTVAVNDGDHMLTAKATDTAGQLTTSAVISVVVDNVADTPVHCGDLDGVAVSLGSKWKATVTVTIHYENEDPVPSATVTGNWSGGATGSVTGTTEPSGQVSFTTGSIPRNKSSVTFTVTGVTGAGLTYVSVDNHDLDGDSNGTTITMSKP